MSLTFLLSGYPSYISTVFQYRTFRLIQQNLIYICISGSVRKLLFLKMTRTNRFVDLNEIHNHCTQNTYECVQKDIFNSDGLLCTKIFSILNAKNRKFIYNSHFFTVESVLSTTPTFVDHSLNPSFPLIND